MLAEYKTCVAFEDNSHLRSKECKSTFTSLLQSFPSCRDLFDSQDFFPALQYCNVLRTQLGMPLGKKRALLQTAHCNTATRVQRCCAQILFPDNLARCEEHALPPRGRRVEQRIFVAGWLRQPSPTNERSTTIPKRSSACLPLLHRSTDRSFCYGSRSEPATRTAIHCAGRPPGTETAWTPIVRAFVPCS